jgi:phosphoribosylformylglycinamidine cyclo-ligase
VPRILKDIQTLGRVAEDEMYRTFNMGLGLIAVVRAESADLALKLVPGARVVGRLESGKPSVRYE